MKTLKINVPDEVDMYTVTLVTRPSQDGNITVAAFAGAVEENTERTLRWKDNTRKEFVNAEE